MSVTNPLLHSERIVDPDGTPSDYFLRQWLSQQNLNEANEQLPGTVEEISQRQIIAGRGLRGGGDLTEDRTLSLDDTSVDAGVYGASNLIPVITVNSQGQLTEVGEVAVQGGGGGGGQWAWPADVGSAGNTAPSNFKGHTFEFLDQVTITRIRAQLSTDTGGAYIAAVYRLNINSNVIEEVVATSAQVPSAGFINDVILTFPLTVPAVCVPAQRYIVVVGRTDTGASPTSAVQLNSSNLGGASNPYPNVPYRLYRGGIGRALQEASMQSLNPAVGTAVSVSDARVFNIGFNFTL